MKINIPELPPGHHIYQCPWGHRTQSGPGLEACPLERWGCALCDRDLAGHQTDAIGHRWTPVPRPPCGEPVTMLEPADFLLEALVAADPKIARNIVERAKEWTL